MFGLKSLGIDDPAVRPGASNGFKRRLRPPRGVGMRGLEPPVAEKIYLFRVPQIETIIRNPKKVGLFGYR